MTVEVKDVAASAHMQYSVDQFRTPIIPTDSLFAQAAIQDSGLSGRPGTRKYTLVT